jgi:hypothetical protein
MKYLIMLSLLALTGCTSAPLTTEENSVRILRKSDADSSCKNMGKVHAPGLASISEEGRESDLKRATVKASGNTVTIDKTDENNTIYGTAFYCPPKT